MIHFLLSFLLQFTRPEVTLLTKANPEAVYLLNRGDEIYSIHESEKQKLQRLTVETSIRNGINPSIPVYILSHESNWDSDAVGDHGLAHGVAQFHRPTFDWMKKKANMPLLQYSSSTDQIILMEWALTQNLGSNWSTFNRLNKIQ